MDLWQVIVDIWNAFWIVIGWLWTAITGILGAFINALLSWFQ